MTAPLQLVTPPGAAAQASAILIASLLKQEQVELTADALNQEFFGVLADFEKQAVRSGLNGADNPFTQLSAELVQWMHQQAAGRRTATDVPAEFSEEIGRSRHMREEAAHNPGLLVIVVRMLEKLAARPELAAHPRVHAEVLKELGSAYAELPVADRQRAVQAGIARLLQARALVPAGQDPAFSAGILHDLGNAHLHLPQMGALRDTAVGAASAAFESALALAPDHTPPGGRALMHLGLATAAGISGRFQAALAEFVCALEIFTPTANPIGYAWVQARSGSVYLHWQGAFAAAQAAYAAALSVHTAESNALMHAGLQAQLALAWLSTPGSAGVPAAARAIEAAQSALPAFAAPAMAHQLSLAFGPVFAPWQGAEGRSLLRAEVAQLADATGEAERRQLCRAHLRMLVADPEQAHAHLQRAAQAL